MTHTNFAIRTYGKSEFALLMFPTIDDPKVAQAKLLRWIKKCAGSRRTDGFTRASWGWDSLRTTRTIARNR